jgi:hypothetical protein
MGHVLRLLLPLTLLALTATTPAAAASPRAAVAAQERAEDALDEAEELRGGDGVRTGRELTGALRELSTGLRHLGGDERERAVDLLERPTDAGDPDAYPLGVTIERSCQNSFCVHWAITDLAAQAMAASVLAEAEKVRAFENGTLGWRPPPSDGGAGGDNRVDIYLQDLGAQRLFGFAATDPNQNSRSQSSYLVIDNDFAPAQYNGEPSDKSLRLTLAHEYGHVLQYGYDVTGDGWHYEASAVWLEHRMDPALDDWVRFIRDGSSGSGWRSLTELPLTTFGHPADPRDAKPYGSSVWNHFLSGRYGTRGDEVQRRAWEASDGLSAPATTSYDTAIRAVGGPGMASDFAAFAAATAEWRVPELGFALAAELPDVERLGPLAADGPTVSPTLDHLTFALYDVPDSSAARIRLAASFPAGMRGALALVARGAAAGGPVTTKLIELPAGGTGGVTLENPNEFIAAGGRITAVLVNADAAQSGFGQTDWIWSRDSQSVAAAVTTDLSGPAITSRTPAPDARRVKTDAQVRVTFSKPVTGIDAKSFSLRGPDGRAVPGAVSYVRASRTATLAPSAPLTDTTRYTVRLTDAVVDNSATSLTPAEWSFRTVRQRPRASIGSLSAGSSGIRFLLRSRDADRLRYRAKLVAAGRTLATKRGLLRPALSRIVRLGLAGHRRARLVVEVRDPQRNRKRIVRTIRVRR